MRPLSRPWTSLLVAALLFCASVPAATGSHSDGRYDLPVVSTIYRPPDTVHDVLVVPPAHGQLVNGNGVLNGMDPGELDAFQTTYLRAIEDSVDMWRVALATMGQPWLASGFTINTWVLGRDAVPTSVLLGADTIIVADEYKTVVLGVAFRGLMLAGGACVVDNSMFGALPESFTYQDMFNVNAQEFGHCLALSHVENNHPEHDVMAGTYADDVGNPGVHLHCVSNLDVLGVEAAVQHHFGFGTGPSTVSVAVTDYVTMNCAALYGP